MEVSGFGRKTTSVKYHRMTIINKLMQRLYPARSLPYMGDNLKQLIKPKTHSKNLSPESRREHKRDSLFNQMDQHWKLNISKHGFGILRPTTKTLKMNQNFTKPTTAANFRMNRSEQARQKCRLHLKMGPSPISQIEDRKGMFSMLPRNNKWIACNITLPECDRSVYEKYFCKNIGKVGPSFEKLDKREYLLYSSDVKLRAGYLELNHFDKSYQLLGHVNKPQGFNMGKMEFRKQFIENNEYSLPTTPTKDIEAMKK